MADFGLSAIVDETTDEDEISPVDGRMKGMSQRIAPELLFPEKFGFTGEFLKRLPSKDTDIYAIGMTILEVSACPFLLELLDSPPGRF